MTYHAEQVRFNLVRSHTDIGVVRANNEDAIVQNSTLGIAVLADGMGGHNAGEVASQQTVENILKGIEECVELLDGELSIDLARNHLKQLIDQKKATCSTKPNTQAAETTFLSTSSLDRMPKACEQ